MSLRKELNNLHNSAHQAHWRMTIRFRVTAALDECVRRIVQPAFGTTDARPCATLVLWGNGGFGTNYRGSAPSHHRQLLELLRGQPSYGRPLVSNVQCYLHGSSLHPIRGPRDRISKHRIQNIPSNASCLLQ